MSLPTYSQRSLIQDKDTLICFNLAEAKFLLKKVVALKECDTLRKLDAIHIAHLDTTITSLKKINSNNSLLLLNKKEELSLKDYKISFLESSLKKQQKLYKRQKLYKILVGALGTLTTGFVTYLWITK